MKTVSLVCERVVIRGARLGGISIEFEDDDVLSVFLSQFTIKEIVDAQGVSELLDEIGRAAVIDHFEIKEAK